jgi:hypothetical protein
VLGCKLLDAECGHIVCCNSFPSQHASKLAAATGHPIIASFEPGELSDTLNGTVQVTFVTFLQNGTPFTIGFCGIKPAYFR